MFLGQGLGRGRAAHILPQDGDLLFHLAPKLVVVQIVVATVVAALGGVWHYAFLGAVVGHDEQGGDECFLHVGEAEVGHDERHGGAEFFGERDAGLAAELGAPVLAVEGPLGQGGIGEEVFPVEAGRPLGEAGVELVHWVLLGRRLIVKRILQGLGRLTVVGTGYHHDTIVTLEAIHLVEEIGSSRRGHYSVDIFEDEKAGREYASEPEHLPNVAGTRRRLYVEQINWLLASS